jgi:DNA helicase-2/ATP-dependent DNA helicase PcrA
VKFTAEQYGALTGDVNTVVFACPGAGKTRVVSGKVIRLLGNDADNPRKIACITFTNGALEEIERRLSSSIGAELADQYRASTIHSFLLNEIVIPYSSAAEDLPIPVKIASPDSEIYEDAARMVFGDRLNPKLLKALARSRRLKDGSPSPVRLVSVDEIRQFWNELRQAGYIEYSAIIYYAYTILVASPRVAGLLAARFSWLVIDEYQDCNDLILDSLKLIHDAGDSKFFIVGDYDQAIYGFNGVSIPALDHFLEHIGARRLSLYGSRRLSERIARVASCILEKQPEISSECDPPQVGAVAVHRLKTLMSAITRAFIPTLRTRDIPFSRAAIVASTGDMLKAIYTSMGQLGHPAVLCSDRLYRMGSVSDLLETICAYILDRSASSFRKGVGASERALSEYSLLLRDASANDSAQFFLKLVDAIAPLTRNCENRSMADDIDHVFSEIERLFSACCISNDDFHLLAMALEKTAESMRQIPEPYALTWDSLAEHSARCHSISLLTIHGSKGLEYDAVAVVGLNDGILPFFATDDIDEEKRKLYVAATRAGRALLLASDIESGNKESGFLAPVRALIASWQ